MKMQSVCVCARVHNPNGKCLPLCVCVCIRTATENKLWLALCAWYAVYMSLQLQIVWMCLEFAKENTFVQCVCSMMCE